MGLSYVWDTNTVIYYLQKAFPTTGEKFINHLLNSYKPAISVITEMELLCYKSATKEDFVLLNNFIANSIVYQLDEPVKLTAVELRKNFRLKLPDAVIAASALVNNHTLITRNVSDFNKIAELTLIDPFNISDDFTI